MTGAHAGNAILNFASPCTYVVTLVGDGSQTRAAGPRIGRSGRPLPGVADAAAT